MIIIIRQAQRQPDGLADAARLLPGGRREANKHNVFFREFRTWRWALAGRSHSVLYPLDEAGKLVGC